MGIWVHLLLSVVSANSACITLSHNETAVINPRKYLGRAVSSVEIKSTGEHKAAILEPGSPTALFRIETGGSDWSFGPSVLLRNVQFFTVLYRDRLEVWKANGDSVDRVWGVNATVNRVVPLQLSEAVGFVYWTQPDFQLFLLDLNSPALSANPIAGVETQDISLIAACSNTNLLLTVQSFPQSSVFTYYEINYNSLIAVKTAIQVNEEVSETYLDALCTSSFHLLLPTALQSWSYKSFRSYAPIPLSFGIDLSLHYGESASTWYLRASRFAVTWVSNVYLVLPGVLRIISCEDVIVSIDEIDSKLVLVEREISSPAHAQTTRSVPLHQKPQQIDNLLWLSNPHYQSTVLVKSGLYIEGFAVRQNSPLVIVSSHSVPYQFDLCTFPQQSKCASITVVSLPYEPGDIVLEACSGENSADSSIALSTPITSSTLTALISLPELVSTWNLRAEWRFPDLPFGFSCVLAQDLAETQLSEIEGGAVQSGRFLCAFVSNHETVVLTLLRGYVIENWKLHSTGLFQSPLAVLTAVARAHFYALYAEDEEQGYLLVWRDSHLEQYPLQAQGLVSMQMTEVHVLLLLGSRVLIAATESMDWQQFEGQYAGMWVGDGRLVLRTADSLEFYELRGSLYVLRGRTAVSTVLLALSNHELVALSASNTLSVYHITGSSQLLFKYSVEIDCPVSYIAASGSVAAYRCPSHVQLLHPHKKQRALLAQSIAVEDLPLAVDTRGRYLFEVHERDGVWRTLRLNLAEPNHQIQVLRIQIDDDYRSPEAISLQGQLTISNAYKTKDFTVKVTLDNHGAVISPMDRSLSGSERQPNASSIRIEPWETSFRMNAFDFFQGQLMHFTVESNSDLLQFEMHQTIRTLYSLVFPAAYREVAIVPEILTLFALDKFALITCKYECSSQGCRISSTRSTPFAEVGMMIAMKLEVMISLGRFTYIRLLGQQYCNYTEACDIDIAVCYDSKNSHYTVISRHTRYMHSRNFHIVPGNLPDTFHLLYYSTVLEHCTAHAEAPMNCTEVAHPSLVLIESVGSVKVSERCWRVYAVTSTLQIVALELCEELTLYSVLPIDIDELGYVTDFLVAGERLCISSESSSFMFSLPDLTLLSKEPQRFLATYRNTNLWKVGSEQPARYFTQQMMKDLFLFDISKPPHSALIAQLPFSNFQFTSENSGFGLVNNTAVLASFSEAEIELFKVDTTLETRVEEFTVTAHNGLSSVTVRVRVVLAGRLWTLWVVAAGTAGYVAIAACRRKKRELRSRSELEMTRLE